MQKLDAIVDRVAPTDLSVLITGESGVGKEVVAQRIASKSLRTDQPFIKINSAAIPNSLLESELFGYQRGAFTGAGNDKRGRIQEAHRGTLFFDEIADLDTNSQGKLLHMLQEGEFTPLGTNEPVTVDVRLLAATNKDVVKEVEAGTFRKDLFYRLNIVQIHVPPLRERKEDIPAFIDFFITTYVRSFNKTQLPIIKSKDYELLIDYVWPGNVRELENFLKNLILFEDTVSSFDALREKIQRSKARSNQNISLVQMGKMAEELVQRKVILRILKQNGWNRKKTAAMLRISYRSLLSKIKQLQIE
ncbi:MAG TPA: sigma 54-interacting transcriptional regulator [Acidobacteriota bacterium]|jgi:two-component system response regulator AtoC